MIDNATIEQWMREANPIPDVDELDADEFARFVAAADTRRAAVMQAPTQHPTPTTTPPGQRRRKVWAFAAGFIVILLAVGAAALFLRGSNTPMADEPAPPTTLREEPEAAINVDSLNWRPMTTPAWGDIDHLEPLPGGGYVAVGRDRSDQSVVMWSPDGVDWFDGDPQRLVGRVQSTPYGYSSSLAVVGEQVAVIQSRYGLDEIPLSIGDPRTGTWQRVSLDVTGIQVYRSRLGLAANDEEVLVAAYAAPAPDAEGQEAVSRQVVVWIVDAERATSTRHSFADSATPSEHFPPFVQWVEERWIVIAPEKRDTLWTSPDGRAWSQVAIPAGMDGVHSLRAGPSGVAATTCRLFRRVAQPPDDGLWYSSDGLDWSLVPEGGGCFSPVIASWGDRGFVVDGVPDSGTGVWVIASDGSGVEVMPSPFEGASAAAASGDTLIVSPSGGGLWLYQEPTDE